MFTTLYINFSDMQGQITLESVVVSGRNLNSSKLSCMSSLPARMRMIISKMLCLLCKKEDETTEHFLLRCESLENIRKPILDDILKILDQDDSSHLLQCVLDPTVICPDVNVPELRILERHTRRLCHALHIERYRLLSPSHTFTVLAPVELRFTPIYQIVAHRHDS